MSIENTGNVDKLVQAGVVQGGVHFHAQPVAELSRPAQLRAQARVFVDREEAQRALHGVLEAESAVQQAGVALISGFSGTGKSALALHWAYGVLGRFDDGQIYRDLRGAPVDAAEVARHCSRALGVAEERIPTSPDEAIGQCRTLTSGRRLLFVFDNVSEPERLLELRPAAPESVVLLLSHRKAPELVGDDVVPIELRALDADYAVRMLAEHCGAERIEAEPDAAEQVAELCGNLPVALRIVAARLRKRPKWSVSRVVTELADDTTRIDRFVDGGRAVVRTALDFAVGQLDDEHAHLYRLLGLVPGPDFSGEAVAELAGLSTADAEDQRDELLSVNLLEENDHGNARFHDLVGLHAGELAAALPEPTRRSALSRLATWYQRMGGFADRVVMEPTRFRVSADDDLVAGENPFDRRTGLEWLERERLNIVAMVAEARRQGWNRTVISLCDSPLWALHNQHKHYRDTLSCLEMGAAAAHAVSDLVAEARMRSLWARLLMELRRFDAAHEQGEWAHELAQRSGHRRALASALEFRGRIYLEQEEWEPAIELFTQSHGLNEELGQARGMALQEHFIGQALDGRGEHERALVYLDTAARRLAEFADRRTPQRIRISTGRVLQNLARHDEAIEVLLAAEADFRERQVSFDRAKPLELLMDSYAAIGDDEAARACRREALLLHEQAHSPGAERLR